MYKRLIENLNILEKHNETNMPVLWLTGGAREYDLIKEIIGDCRELLGKIENGTLIDTKVRKGQRVYMKGFFDNEVEEYIVSDITLENGELEVHLKHDYDEGKTCYSRTVLGIGEIGRKVFLTKTEMEKKLREVKEISND